MGRLDGKVAIITGAARGMGAAFAKLFVEEGAKVVLTDVLVEEGCATAEVLGANAVFLELDVTDEAQWQAVADQTVTDFGKIDILVNNAGILLFKSLEDSSVQEFEKLLNVNLIGAYAGMRTIFPIMKKGGGGSIVNMSSSDGLEGANAVGLYGATKWGLRGLTKAAALEFGLDKVRVNSVHPGGIDTPMTNPTAGARAVFDQGFQMYPVQRAGDPSEVAYVVLFLASDESSYVYGAEIAVDGGMTAGHYYNGLPGSPGVR